ncbi:MAG: hypothetical protein QW043_02525 [Desulfurococcaceae archaeon]
MSKSTSLLDCVWRCRCWFCRVFTRRVLSHFAKFEVAVPGKGGGAMAQEADLVKELKELKTSIEELKRTIVEIKASIADLTGPFSGYKPVEEAKPVVEVPLQAPPQASAQSTGVEGPAERTTEKPAVLDRRAESAEKPGFSRVLTGISEVLREERVHIAETSFRKMLNVMKILYELRRLYPKTSIESIIKMLEEIRAFTPEEISLVKASANLIEESLKEGVSHEENVLMMFMLLRQLGVRSEDVEEEALRTVIDVLASKRRKQVTGEGAVTGVKEGKSEWESPQR